MSHQIPFLSNKQIRKQFEENIKESSKNDDALFYVLNNEFLEKIFYTYIKNEKNYTTENKTVDLKEGFKLNNWLVYINEKINFRTEVLYLAINIINRFLERKNVKLNKLKFLGACALYISSKLFEKNEIKISIFIQYLNIEITEKEIIEGEKYLLEVLKYDINFIQPTSFEYLLNVCNGKKSTCLMARYILEIALLNYKTQKIKMSLLAATSCYIACKILDDNFTLHIENFTQYKIKTIKYVSGLFLNILYEEKIPNNLFKKFQNYKNNNLADFLENYIEKSRNTYFKNKAKYNKKN